MKGGQSTMNRPPSDSTIRRREPLTAYERAVCYYTLPRILPSVTVGMIAAYAVCLLEAFGALSYGLIVRDDNITRIGAWALAGIVLLGIIAFFFRTLIGEIRRRRLLAEARGLPNPADDSADLPDPFAEHVLLRCPFSHRGKPLECADSAGHVFYQITNGRGSDWRILCDAHKRELLRLKIENGASSFLLREDTPSLVAMYSGETLVARLRNRFSFGEPMAVLSCLDPEPHEYVIRSHGIYRDHVLVGRFYDLRGYLYLDVHQSACEEAVLGVFATMV